MGNIKAICISEKRGTKKISIKQGMLIENFGIKGDAHGGNWHRQISLLSFERIEEFKMRGAAVEDGAFGENIIIEGIDFSDLLEGTRLKSGEIVLEVTQIGKECHNHCEIFKKMGECIMPTNGIFARVLHGGILKEGDEIQICTKSEL